MKTMAFVLAVIAFFASTGSFAGEPRRLWNFDNDKPGTRPNGFFSGTGGWQVKAAVTAPSPPNVLAQLARSGSDAYNLALLAGGKYKDLDLTVKLRAIGGVVARGGGVAWRVKDSRNYYVAGYDPLEKSLKLYRLQNNGRVELGRAEVFDGGGWHQIRVSMVGDRIECSFDGRKYFDVRDPTFRDSGTIGVWTRGDAETFFDNLTVGAR